MVENHSENILKELYEEFVQDDLDSIRLIHSENKIFQRIRENGQDNWEIVELCREILFNNVKMLESLKQGVEDARTKIKEFGRLCR